MNNTAVPRKLYLNNYDNEKTIIITRDVFAADGGKRIRSTRFLSPYA